MTPESMNEVKINLLSETYSDIMKELDLVPKTDSKKLEKIITKLIDGAFAAGYGAGKESKQS